VFFKEFAYRFFFGFVFGRHRSFILGELKILKYLLKFKESLLSALKDFVAINIRQLRCRFQWRCRLATKIKLLRSRKVLFRLL